MESPIDITVVVPVRNEGRNIRATLTELLDQDYSPDRYEVIVVDGRSDDNTSQVVRHVISERSDRQVRLLDNPGRLSSCARNLGVRAARGELIAVIDGHVKIPTRQLFASMQRLKTQHAALCLARPAPLFMSDGKGTMAEWIARARKTWLAHSQVSYIYSDHEGFVDPVSSGFAYDRAIFEQVGYFDESFDAAEDVEFHHRLKRAGIQAYTSAELTIYSFPRSSLRGLFRQMTRYGVGRIRLIGKHRDAFSIETLVPAGIFLYFALLAAVAALGVWRPLWAAIYATGFAVYAAILLATGIASPPKHKGLLASLKIAAAIATTHLGLGWGLVKETVAGRPWSSPLRGRHQPLATAQRKSTA